MATAKKGTSSSTAKKSAAGGKGVGGTKATARKPAASKAKPKGGGHGSGRRELIDTGSDKRFVRRDGQGQFTESDDVGRSLAADRRQTAKTKVKSGQGDRGDR